MTLEVMFLLGWAAPRLPVYLDGKQRGWVDTLQHHRLSRQRQQWGDRQVELGAPEQKHTALWVWTDSPAALKAVRRFRPSPSIVLQVGRGSRRLVLWGLHDAVPEPMIVAANKRLAYRFKVPQKPADPSLLRVPLTSVRVGKRPLPVEMTRCEPDFYEIGEIVGRLRDPPRPYMDRLRAGEV